MPKKLKKPTEKELFIESLTKIDWSELNESEIAQAEDVYETILAIYKSSWQKIEWVLKEEFINECITEYKDKYFVNIKIREILEEKEDKTSNTNNNFKTEKDTTINKINNLFNYLFNKKSSKNNTEEAKNNFSKKLKEILWF